MWDVKVEGENFGDVDCPICWFLMGIAMMHNYGRLKRFWEIKTIKLKIKGEKGYLGERGDAPVLPSE